MGTCSGCRWWDRYPEAEHAGRGLCREPGPKAQALVMLDAKNRERVRVVTVWPETAEGERCPKFQEGGDED